MNFAGIGKKDLTHSDSESSNEEYKLSNLSTESSSDSNDSMASESLTQPHTTAFMVDSDRHHSTRNPMEHDEIVPLQPEDNSMELAASGNSEELHTLDTTDDETSGESNNRSEKTPKKLRKKRQRPLSLVDAIPCKRIIDEPCPDNSGSSSDSGDGSSSIELSSSDDESSNDK